MAMSKVKVANGQIMLTSAVQKACWFEVTTATMQERMQQHAVQERVDWEQRHVYTHKQRLMQSIINRLGRQASRGRQTDSLHTATAGTFDIPDLQRTIKHATPNEAPIMVVCTGSHSNPARLSQLRLDDSLLQHIPGVPHTYGPILAAGHASVAIRGMPLGMSAGTDVSLGVPQIPNVHVTCQADSALFTVSVIHLDLGRACGNQECIPCTAKDLCQASPIVGTVHR